MSWRRDACTEPRSSPRCPSKSQSEDMVCGGPTARSERRTDRSQLTALTTAPSHAAIIREGGGMALFETDPGGASELGGRIRRPGSCVGKIGLQRKFDHDKRPFTEGAADVNRSVQGLHAVAEADQPRASRRVGAADSVIVD